MTAYYNENDPYCVQWLRNLINAGLIAPGVVDDRDIRDVTPGDVAGFTQVHTFAGLGGWSYACRLAGWPDDRPIWTGSCPCQPFSAAGKRAGFADERHLWPAWHHLIRECRPARVFGEQVSSAAAWLGLVRGDLEALGYAVGAIPVEAASVGAPHKRDRYWFVADATSNGRRERWAESVVAWEAGRTVVGGASLADANGAAGRRAARHADTGPSVEALRRGEAQSGRCGEAMADAGEPRLETSERQASFGAGRREEGRAATECDWWRIEPDVGRVAHGIPARVAKLRALGNAIVPQVAAEILRACMEASHG